MAGNVELSALDLLEEHCDIVVIKWECPTEQGVQDDPTRPDVHLRTYTRGSRDFTTSLIPRASSSVLVSG